MTNRKVMPLEKEKQHEGYEAAVKEIEKGLDSLEKNVPVNSPELQFFEGLIADQRQLLKKKLLKDLGIFAVVALLVLSIVLFTLYKAPVFFFILQMLVTVFIVAYIAARIRKQVSGP